MANCWGVAMGGGGMMLLSSTETKSDTAAWVAILLGIAVIACTNLWWVLRGLTVSTTLLKV